MNAGPVKMLFKLRRVVCCGEGSSERLKREAGTQLQNPLPLIGEGTHLFITDCTATSVLKYGEGM